MKQKKIKREYVDDGHTIYNMDVDGMPHRRVQSKDGLNVTKEEKRAMIKAALIHYLPILGGVILCFLVAMLIILWWLH
ncbi:MAG: hypothetical protein PUH11_06835 [Bacilli bacterium]|nr:hypothetical protein [Bacilli bacterium]MDD7315423.1 hypothetical protein [Bacilli bacterium]MDY4052581.1 hypothetical protein [Bacilli bacterium]